MSPKPTSKKPLSPEWKPLLPRRCKTAPAGGGAAGQGAWRGRISKGRSSEEKMVPGGTGCGGTRMRIKVPAAGDRGCGGGFPSFAEFRHPCLHLDKSRGSFPPPLPVALSWGRIFSGNNSANFSAFQRTRNRRPIRWKFGLVFAKFSPGGGAAHFFGVPEETFSNSTRGASTWVFEGFGVANG